MKKKTKKPIFDKRCPGARMIVYGAILMMISGLINAFMSWSYVVVVFGGGAETSDVIGNLISLCLQVGLAFIVALDAINNRNKPSQARRIMINVLCVAAISILLLVLNTADSSIVIAGVSLAGAIIAIIGTVRNRRAAAKM